MAAVLLWQYRCHIHHARGAAGMREVGAEAGVSLRLVQYYFGTKEELLLAAMQNLAARFSARAVARFREASGSGGRPAPATSSRPS